jgi:ribose transport system substrate-binding protein
MSGTARNWTLYLAGVIASFGIAVSGPAFAEPDLAAAKAVIEAHSKKPTFTAPGPPFDAKACMAGKKILSIPVSSTIPFIAGIETSMAQVAKEVGFTFQEWKNQASPTQWVQGMEFAINNHFNAVDLLSGIIPSTLAPQAAAAKAADVRVFASHYMDVTQTKDPTADVSLPMGFSTAGEIMGAWIAVKVGGKANVLVIGSDDVNQTGPLRKNVQSALDKYCGGGCKNTYVNVPLSDWSTKIQTTVQSALLADSSINYVVPIYDSMAQFVLPALNITGRKDVKIVSFNGTPFVLDLVRRSDVEMDVGESLDWIGRATLDGYMRALCKLPVPDRLNVPLYIFDASNAADAGIPAEFNKGYGNGVDGFTKLWELK